MYHTPTHHQLAPCGDKSLMDRLRGKIGEFTLLPSRINRRRHLASLNALSNRQLSDIGLHRDDLYESAALGMGDDVTVHLAKIAKQRRRIIYRRGRKKSD